MGTGPYKNIVFAKNLLEAKLNKELNKEYKKSFYISDYLGYYEVYGENNIQTYVLNKIPNKETAVYLIGHSLVGWNAMHLSEILSDKGYNVKMLIALDSVGTGLFIKFPDIYNTSPSPKSNYFIYITCEGGSYSFSDFVADLGEQLKEINPKGHSIKYKINADRKYKTGINHLDADGMFDEKIQNGLSALYFMLNDIKNTLNIIMRAISLFIILILSIVFYTCKDKEAINIKYKEVKYIDGSYYLFFNSDKNSDSLSKIENRKFGIIGLLDHDENCEKIEIKEYSNKCKYIIEGYGISIDSLYKDKHSVILNFNENNKSFKKELSSKTIIQLLSNKDCIESRVISYGYFFKSPIYSEPFCIPVKDILKVLNDTIE